MGIFIVILLILSLFISFVLLYIYNEEKSGTEIIAFSILMVFTGFVFYYIDQHGMFGHFIGLGLVLVGFFLGGMRFLFKP
ncbi:hypothetical protein LGQ02_10135 [Bacillus shivajii]|uniref:hypothetical protein n=1 Tax=Bacillus shivajii TaxID=1983719 RepID=UPI001CFA8098|nr:hypothetical protein [Bacillus shivajii]UCZ55051.1 hypothetical protein LGQ02_10135 [Bacillus shivajii]